MRQVFLKGAIIISLGGFIAKLMGALYKIPLTNVLGGEGIGIYQMVYPLYTLLLTVSAMGIPSGISKLVAQAEYENPLKRAEATQKILNKSLILFSFLGLLASIIMLVLAKPMSNVQNQQGLETCYYYLAPSVFFVSVLSCFRGYFQGKSNMTPTAVSEILEQAIKIGFGLIFAFKFKDNLYKAVSFTILAVTISEVVTTVLMAIFYFFTKKVFVSPLYKTYSEDVKYSSILKLTLPVTIASGILPLSQMLDSVIICRSLSVYCDNSVALYGLFSGGAITIINLPVSISYGLAVAIIPLVSRLVRENDFRKAKQKMIFAIKCTMFISLPASVFLLLFPEQVSKLIFRNLSACEIQTLSGIIRVTSFSALLLSVTQTLSACLTGIGKPKISAISLSIACVVKTILEVVLLKIPEISINGAGISAMICYFVALIINLLYIIREKHNLLKIFKIAFKFAVISFISGFFAYAFKDNNAVIILVAMIVIYFVISYFFKAFDRDELNIFKIKKRRK